MQLREADDGESKPTNAKFWRTRRTTGMPGLWRRMRSSGGDEQRRVGDGFGETQTGSAARVPTSSKAQTFYFAERDLLDAAAERNGVVELRT
ncbi:hypothetical protein PIB30_026753 [Stylosanthes scabra]|uniref:Uncharacterized protein n=1 Tax=Stylosanthes scabra TaxID=79078 RepID=A0ABU6WAN7_9FABA|nr:hypothetical protein [Stylosanthes scabra]